jgi:hypothetical protein
MNAQRVQEAAGRQIEVLFVDEQRSLMIDVVDDTDADHIAAALVDCLHASTVDDAEGRLQDGLEGRGTVRRAP